MIHHRHSLCISGILLYADSAIDSCRNPTRAIGST
jgi:hypothetical protein